MFSKVLVANRGEIAIRAFRAAYELGIGTVAVFPHEDRNSVHRLKAAESYQIGEEGHPVRAYLSIEAIIDAAKSAGADAIYPGYGFLSENPDLAAACEREGITFIGPSAAVLEMAGNKATAIATAKAAGLPVLKSSEPSADIDALLAAAEEFEYPIFVKAVAGGGGRGMRRVAAPEQLRESIEAASREAESAVGAPPGLLEPAGVSPRPNAVEMLAGHPGHVM
uniref:biotin carboxylase N-terminal domain-containing protein n=1 Tax=Nocardia neocaledoniensis TaxID=236511 RepID=UPI0024575BC4